jgi:signal transduction histidine kinase
VLKLVEELCGPVALAMENAQLYQQAQRNALELEHRVAERTQALAQTNAELLQAMQRAEAADRIKSAFLATMSHELRTPLNSIIGFTGIVLQGLAGPLNAEQSKQLGMVRDSSRHLLALINDVLDISKIEAGELKVGREPFEPALSIQKVMAIVTPLAEKKQLTLATEVAPDIGTMVSDSRRVEQVLLNLLGNAIKFSEKGAVTLRAQRVDDFQAGAGAAVAALRVQVTDTGIGIQEEDMAVLFTPFRQVDSALSRKHDGTGLGLAICQRLAHLMGGKIEAQSVWGQGSTFTVTLPLQAPEVVEDVG